MFNLILTVLFYLSGIYGIELSKKGDPQWRPRQYQIQSGGHSGRPREYRPAGTQFPNTVGRPWEATAGGHGNTGRPEHSFQIQSATGIPKVRDTVFNP